MLTNVAAVVDNKRRRDASFHRGREGLLCAAMLLAPEDCSSTTRTCCSSSLERFSVSLRNALSPAGVNPPTFFRPTRAWYRPNGSAIR
jgi:hypothetical protein